MIRRALLLTLLTSRAWAGGDYEQAKMQAGGNVRDLAVSHEVESLLRAKEALVAEKRRAGISLIETYLREHQPGPETPEVLFQLAELRWEESKSAFLSQMAVHTAAAEKCAKEGHGCRPPPMPRLDLSSSQKLYQRLISEYPSFRKIDAVRYL